MLLAWRDFIPSETNCPINRKLKCNVNVIAQVVEIHLQYRTHQFDSWVRKNPWRRDRLPTPVFMGYVVAQLIKNPTCNAGDLGSISRLGRTPGGGKGYPLEYSGLEKSMDCIVHGVAKSWTWLSNCHSLTHSNVIASTCMENQEMLWEVGLASQRLVDHLRFNDKQKHSRRSGAGSRKRWDKCVSGRRNTCQRELVT